MIHTGKQGIAVIGGGLAGTEAAWQAASFGVKVKLFEMRPVTMTPAHHTGLLAELVCSNSLRAEGLANAVGVLKEEMRQAGSLIMRCADAHRVPAGGALAVDREQFARAVTEAMESHPDITVVREEVAELPAEGVAVVASGPLTSPLLAGNIQNLTGAEYLYFHDAAAPIVSAASIDRSRVFSASRYGKGQGEYLNCPLDRDEYDRFYDALMTAEVHHGKDFEKETFFEGCMPVEVIALRGRDTLRYGPMKPVGLIDPRTGKQPHAVVQLRQDNAAGTLFNLVGFQTRLTWPEQKRVFGMIPGLEQAEFVRYGVMHRNTFLNSPRVLRPTLQFKPCPSIFFAGQITGVEGYVESAANGIVAGTNAARAARGIDPLEFPPETAHGALCRYVSSADPGSFQPMNITFGLLPPGPHRVRNKRQRNTEVGERALDFMTNFLKIRQV